MYSMSVTGRSFNCLSVGVICSYFLLPGNIQAAKLWIN